ncbi:hypothetical protein C7C46_08465 [Streptomyces tateyamensis]|uniref:Acyl-CoA carboxylase subunit epsilon n=1 Tax=Streptomyces tateyamensis TaxID=565073 RepID=A0A2V4PIQ6_9ACTN|nr:acyl-CoA carboxylase subunit epsilon [Streptomyces tateyamensis]PYC83770.1 hypothetical protein C7C46_08465 [Streptomyces tateyamensis]
MTDNAVLRVVSGRPAPEELAVLTAVLLARAATAGAGTQADTACRPHRARWLRRERVGRAPGPRSWQGLAAGATGTR